MNIWLLILSLAAVTLIERISFTLWVGRWSIPPWAERGLGYVPVTVLSALIMPGILRADGLLDLTLLNPKLIAGIVAIVVTQITHNVLLTIIVGMLVFWGMRWS